MRHEAHLHGRRYVSASGGTGRLGVRAHQATTARAAGTSRLGRRSPGLAELIAAWRLDRHAHDPMRMAAGPPDRNGEEHDMGNSDFAHTVVPSAEDVLEDLLAQNPPEQRPSLRAAFNLGRAHELSVQAHRAARALEELAEPDKPSSLDDLGLVYPDWGQGPSYEC